MLNSIYHSLYIGIYAMRCTPCQVDVRTVMSGCGCVFESDGIGVSEWERTWAIIVSHSITMFIVLFNVSTQERKRRDSVYACCEYVFLYAVCEKREKLCDTCWKKVLYWREKVYVRVCMRAAAQNQMCTWMRTRLTPLFTQFQRLRAQRGSLLTLKLWIHVCERGHSTPSMCLVTSWRGLRYRHNTCIADYKVHYHF